VILARYVAVRFLGAFLLALGGVVGIFLAVDFVDNSAGFTGPGWGPTVLLLYAYKAAVVVYQIAPAALLLGAAIATSTFRSTREYTAMRSVGLGPWRLAVPVLLTALLAGAALVVLHDLVGVEAAARAEEIAAVRFGRGGDLRRFLAAREPKRWFRGHDGRRIYRLARRIDASRMRPDGDGWILEDVEDRTFAPDGSMRLETAPARRFAFDEPAGAFSIVPGRPTEMRWATLLRQIDVRRRLGQPVADFELERYNRLAYPLVGVPGALLAVALALRRNRRGHLATSLLESVGVSLLLWGAQGVTWALGLSGRVPPWTAAWAPNVLFLLAGLLAVRRAE